MTTFASGITLVLADDRKTTPFTQVQVTGLSFSVELRALELLVFRYDVLTRAMVPLAGVGVTLRLLTSNQTDSLSTDVTGALTAVFPDNNIEVRLNPAQVPAGHRGVLNYAVRAQKRNQLTVVFIPDSLRRYYPQLQLV